MDDVFWVFWVYAAIRLLLSLFIAWMAGRYQRSSLWWFILAVFFGPLVSFIALWMSGVDRTGEGGNLGPYREPTRQDTHESTAWQVKMLRKRAHAHEEKGEYKNAIACLAEIIAKAGDPVDAEEARAQVARIRAHLKPRAENATQPPPATLDEI